MNDLTTRDRIVVAADQLFYERGYEHTSFADIAGAVEIARGNFYHHFRAKDEILQAVIALRLDKTRQMIARWEAKHAGPTERIRGFIHILLVNRTPIKRHGCPVGTLCTELAKLGHPAGDEANAIFTLFRSWLRRQFVQLGHARRADALAMHLLARSQGIAVLANAYRDDRFIKREVADLCTWLDDLAGGDAWSRP